MLDTFQNILRQIPRTTLIALRALRRNKMRSTLTVLGIVIGVASVVCMIAVGNGAQRSIQSQVASLGENLLTIFAASSSSGAVRGGLGSASTITLADAEAIKREVAGVMAVSPEVSTNAQAIANGRNWSTNVVGESEDYLVIRNWQLQSGWMFTEREVRAAAKVALMGTKASSELFGPLDPVGQTVRIKNIPFVIIGLLTSKGSSMGGNQDDRIIIPYTTAMKRITGDKYLRSVNVQVVSSDRMDAAQEQITSLLRQRHRLDGGGREDDFSIFNQKEIADTASSITQIVTLLLGAIAGISLLVGGIGIMNIMLVSVTERIREIGVRMAVGAQPIAVKLQFLIEAITLSLLGGVIGVLLGVGASSSIGLFTSSFKAIVSVNSIVLALSVSLAIGVFFGFYPARKAAALNPIDALRSE
jgi:putative ABC transport system permease protein